MESYDVRRCPLFVRHPRSVKVQADARPIVAKNIVTGGETVYSSISAAEKTGEFLREDIQRCLDGQQYSHYGFAFRYA